MQTIAQNDALIKQLFEILEAHRPALQQQRVYQRVVGLVLAEIFVFTRHTVTQLLMALGLADADWSGWYRVFSAGRVVMAALASRLFGLTLAHVPAEEVYVVGGDGTQTPRSSHKLEGASWLVNHRTPPFMRGVHCAQQWFNGSWFLPAENGYSRAVPLYFVPAFTGKSNPQAHAPRKEWEAALDFLRWLRAQLDRCGRTAQRVLMVADGSYDTLGLWQALPARVILLARSARNRALYHLPGPQTGRGRRRTYGDRAPTPAAVWRQRTRWSRLKLRVRGHDRTLHYRVAGPFLRKGAPDCPLMLIVVRGEHTARHRREPLPLLVNAVQDAAGQWGLPLPVETLLFWAWQRWELEVCHRELKSGFGLGHKQCWNPQAAVVSVQWSAWVYAVLLLAGYRAWGLTSGPPVPTRWWSGAGRWSLTTLWRGYRAALWGCHHFHALCSPSPGNWPEKEALLDAMRHAVFAATLH